MICIKCCCCFTLVVQLNKQSVCCNQTKHGTEESGHIIRKKLASK